MPALSILLATYNGASYLDEQIASILAQSFEDFELLVRDDGSTDRTPALIDAWARRGRRLRRLPSEGNRGQKRRLRELLDAAGADLVSISDQDDVWDADKLALLAGRLAAGTCASARRG